MPDDNTPIPGKTDKAELRRFAKMFRKRLPVDDISLRICERVRTWQAYRQAGTVLAFQAMPFEINLQPLFGDTGKTWLLPRVEEIGKQQVLEFRHYRNGDALQKSRFGVAEPLPGQRALAPDEPVDLVFLPGLMFGRNGNRLGYGLSFYDRFLKSRFPNAKPILVGVVADSLLLPSLPSDPWDIPADWIATEENLYPAARPDGQ